MTDAARAGAGTGTTGYTPTRHARRAGVTPRVRQLNGFDSLLLYVDSANALAQGGFLQIYAPVPGDTPATRFRRLQRLIEHNLDAASCFRRVIVRSPYDLDHAWFVDGVELDIDHHVVQHALPAPGNVEQLNETFARIFNEPMDVQRPLWEIHVVDGLDKVDGVPKGAFALIVKFHHAAVDGGSAREMTEALHRTDARRLEYKPRRRGGRKVPQPPVTLASALFRTAGNYTRLGLALGSELMDTLPRVGRGLLARLTRGKGGDVASGGGRLRVPHTRFNAPVSSHRAYTWLVVDMDTVRRLRRGMPGATVNDVYLTLVGGALRHYLEEHAELPRVSLVAGVSVNVRSESEAGEGGNQVAMIRVPVGTDEPDARRRFERIVAASAVAKAPVRGEGGRKSASWAKMMPAPLLVLLGAAMGRARLGARMPPYFNLMATNVPGPRQALYLDGARLLAFSGTPPILHGVSLVFNATNFEDSLSIAAYACHEAVPDMVRLRACMARSLAELRATLPAERPSRARRATGVAAKARVGRTRGAARIINTNARPRGRRSGRQA